MMVEVFKTNVQETEQADVLIGKLCGDFPGHRFNFDLDDCDRILRVEAAPVEVEGIISVLNDHGFECTVLM